MPNEVGESRDESIPRRLKCIFPMYYLSNKAQLYRRSAAETKTPRIDATVRFDLPSPLNESDDSHQNEYKPQRTDSRLQRGEVQFLFHFFGSTLRKNFKRTRTIPFFLHVYVKTSNAHEPAQSPTTATGGKAARLSIPRQHPRRRFRDSSSMSCTVRRSFTTVPMRTRSPPPPPPPPTLPSKAGMGAALIEEDEGPTFLAVPRCTWGAQIVIERPGAGGGAGGAKAADYLERNPRACTIISGTHITSGNTTEPRK